jgi:hypothetical protein
MIAADIGRLPAHRVRTESIASAGNRLGSRESPFDGASEHRRTGIASQRSARETQPGPGMGGSGGDPIRCR